MTRLKDGFRAKAGRKYNIQETESELRGRNERLKCQPRGGWRRNTIRYHSVGDSQDGKDDKERTNFLKHG